MAAQDHVEKLALTGSTNGKWIKVVATANVMTIGGYVNRITP